MHIIPDTHRLHIIGDYHGGMELLIENLKALSAVKAPSSVILLGDYDIHSAAQLSDFEGLLSHYDINCYLMRGNHDNPNLWQDRGIAAILETAQFKLLEDVDVIQWRGARILTVGGATSTDRTCVRFDEGHCWPKIEGIANNALTQVKQLKNGEDFDVLLTHTGDLSDVPVVNPFTESYASTDDDLLEDLANERKLIRQIQILSGVDRHYFGHFHRTWYNEAFGIKMRCLNICEMVDLKYESTLL